MSYPANILQNVVTYQEGSLAILANFGPFIGPMSDKKYKNFQDFTAQLGQTVSWDLPPRLTTTDSLVVSWQGVQQRIQNLTVDKQKSSAFNFNDGQFIYNVEDYIKKFGRSATAALGTQIEGDIATVCATVPYRFYGNGRTPIVSVDQMTEAFAQFETWGTTSTSLKCTLQDLSVQKMVANSLNQFVPSRNETYAGQWMIGELAGYEVYKSNLLPTHRAGNLGKAGTTLTVASIAHRNADGGIDQITFSGAGGADANAVKQYDRGQFTSAGGVVNFLTWTGYLPSAAPVQVLVTEDAASSGGNVTITFEPPLQVAPGPNQNITTEIVPGMTFELLPDIRCGVITMSDPIFLAMPKMNTKSPYATATATDEETGVSLRTYYGAGLGNDSNGYIYDQIYGYTAVPEYMMTIAYPLNTVTS